MQNRYQITMKPAVAMLNSLKITESCLDCSSSFLAVPQAATPQRTERRKRIGGKVLRKNENVLCSDISLATIMRVLVSPNLVSGGVVNCSRALLFPSPSSM